MIAQISTKVKRKIESHVNTLSPSLHRPQRKFLQEIVSSTIAKGTLNLTAQARYLNEETSVKHTQKRLQYNVAKNGDILYLANMRGLSHPAEPIDEHTFIYLDGGDLTYSQATGYEWMSCVRDGSKRGDKLKRGYLLNMIACRNGYGNVFPVYLDIFSRETQDYTSDNTEEYHAIEAFMSVHGSKGIWTMDRGYDKQDTMKYIMDRGGQFNIRSNGKRHLQCGKERKSALDIAHSLNRRYELNTGRYGYKHCMLGDYAVTLIYFKNIYSDLILISSGHLKKSKEIKRRIQGYFKRWGIEESYKFLKQSFGLEKARVSKFEGIKCLLGIAMLSWQVLILVKNDEELSEIVYKKAKTLSKEKVKFIYYRIIMGLQEILRFTKGLFHLRKRKKKDEYKMLSLFDILDNYEKVYYGG